MVDKRSRTLGSGATSAVFSTTEAGVARAIRKAPAPGPAVLTVNGLRRHLRLLADDFSQQG